MKWGGVSTKRKTVDIDRGLFLVRYSSADDPRRPPIVRIAVDEDSAADATLIMHPDARDAVLSEPGTALAVRAAAPAKLLVEVRPAEENGSTAATVKVEALNPGPPPEPTERLEAGADGTASVLRLRAHVAGIGDVMAEANAWVAGPSAPSRIEGIAVEWLDRPTRLDLRYAVRCQGSDGSRLAPVGSFVGTRGRAQPVTGAVFELTGDDAREHQIVVEALFLGAPVTRTTGRRVVVSGPTSREPLVGLRLDLVRREAAVEPAAPRNGRTRPGQVRVFRGRSRAQPAAV